MQAPDKPQEDDREKLKLVHQAYQAVFKGEQGKLILEDLAEKCHYNNTTFDVDNPKMLPVNEGMRMAFLHIKTMVEIDLEEIYKIYKGEVIEAEIDEENI